MLQPVLQGHPILTSDTVFFIGNGVLRVAPSTAEDQEGRPFRSPSWSEYMDSLWSFIKLSPESPKFLSLGDFSRLPAPRQAEWFDREFRALHGTEVDVAALRLHLLGCVLHPNSHVLSNALFRQLADLIVGSVGDVTAKARDIDVITTNVDCALEQNIAWAIEMMSGIGQTQAGGPANLPALTVRRATIETIVDFRLSARWEMLAGGSGQELTVRLWKLHGCLRDLKIQLSRDVDMARDVLRLAETPRMDICGHVPTDRLASNLAGGWRLAHDSDRQRRPYSGVFSQSEYFGNLLLLARHEPGAGGADKPHAVSGDEQQQRLGELRELLASRPLIFVGYSIPEVNVNVVYALQRYRQRDAQIKRWQLLAQRERSATTDERLRQLGVDPWPFGVSALGYASIPGRLRAARRHEWRSISVDPLAVSPDKDWRKALEKVAGQAWLEPQLRALRSLNAGEGVTSASDPPAGGHRLVVAGLASIWHAVALTRSADFPVRRRVSAQLISVDAQVPGGSGLVPVMVAAAAAGPAAVGSLTFFSNAPREWGSWDEIEDMCLSAGISVHSWSPGPGDGHDAITSVARTSHVILFDATEKDAGSDLPRQRFIMDVQALADESLSRQVTDWSRLKVPPARPLAGFQKSGQEDFLFTDKESDPDIITNWSGPTVYETGASGDELVTRLQAIGARPYLDRGSWLLRPDNGRARRARTQRGHIRWRPARGPGLSRRGSRLAALAECGDLRERYLAKVVSFGRSGIWDFRGREGFSYYDELDYGIWLRDRWPGLAAPMWDLLGTGENGVLSEPHARIGGGVLTTIHDGGLMALWRWRDGRPEQVAVHINTSPPQDGQDSITVRCELYHAVGQQCQPGPIVIGVSRDQMTLAVGDIVEKLGPSSPIRRNTLAAGDTVRGAMAYGLWAAAYKLPPQKPVDIQRIFLASAALASLKCYAGSFVNFLRLLEQLRGTPAWAALWDFG